MEAVQQFKTMQKRKVDNARNQKRRNIFGVKTNCETASMEPKMKKSVPSIKFSMSFRITRQSLSESSLQKGKSENFLR
jgi:hypothetical protein